MEYFNLIHEYFREKRDRNSDKIDGGSNGEIGDVTSSQVVTMIALVTTLSLLLASLFLMISSLIYFNS